MKSIFEIEKAFQHIKESNVSRVEKIAEASKLRLDLKDIAANAVNDFNYALLDIWKLQDLTEEIDEYARPTRNKPKDVHKKESL